MLSLVHLSGPRRGVTERFTGDRIDLWLRDGGAVAGPPDTEVDENRVARIEVKDDIHRVTAAREVSLRLNGRRVGEADLESGDVLQLGDGGPFLRFRSVRGSDYKSLYQAIGDCVDCARYGGTGALDRLGVLAGGAVREMSTQVRPAVRFLAVGMLLTMIGLVALWQRNLALEERLRAQATQIEGLEELLARSEAETLDPAEVRRMRDSLDAGVDRAMERLDALERRSGARSRVIAEASRAVVFIQGEYGFVEHDTGRIVRTRAASGGPEGTARLSFAESDPPLAIRYTGTGFVATAEGLLLTNRHVAVPWEFDETVGQLQEAGFEPRMRRMLGYLPEEPEPFQLDFVRAHDELDVAVLRCDAEIAAIPSLTLRPRSPELGDEVIVLGYPTGVGALLARSEDSFIDELSAAGELDFWQLVERIAGRGMVRPLATVGAVGQRSDNALVYDAETAQGGSGGPVLALDGTVVAINSAMVPEFGGSNLGVPAAAATTLIDTVEAER